MGSACLFFGIGPQKAILSDVNAELVNTFCLVRNKPNEVLDAISRFSKGKDEYYRIRALAPESLNDVERAARFIFLNRYCFNGIYRTNKKGEFNVPYSSGNTGELPTMETLNKAAEMLANSEIYHQDFEQTLNSTKQGDFVYLDPPYAVTNRRIFRQYDPQTFGLEDIERLKTSLHMLDAKGVDFVVSYALSPEGLLALGGWNLIEVSTQRNVAGFAKHRKQAVEIIATNIGR